MQILSKLALASVLASSLVGGVALADKATKPATPAQPPAVAPPATTTAPTASKEDVAKFLAFFDKLVDIAVADKDDCTKMATEVNAHIDANKEILQKAADAQAKGMKLPDDATAHMTAAAKRLGPAMATCAKDKTVQAAFMRMPHGGSSAHR